MVGSDEASLVSFLVSGGFECRRKCYETEAFADDYIGKRSNINSEHCRPGEKDYDTACLITFNYYVETHKAINPWTAGYGAFRKILPAEVVYIKERDQITSLAFVEGNEIAYVCGKDLSKFKEFAQGLITEMLVKNKSICFESDDCDTTAMLLKSLFKTRNETSFDTYVLK